MHCGIRLLPVLVSILGEAQGATVALVHELHGNGEGHINDALAQRLLRALSHKVHRNGQHMSSPQCQPQRCACPWAAFG